MAKNKKILLIAGVICLAVCLCAVLVMCGGGQDTDPSGAAGDAEKINYTVKIKNQAGSVMEGVGVYIYTDSTLEELVWFAKTDAEGQMSFVEVKADTYVAVLKDVPTGYAVEEYYPLTGEVTEITLSAGTMEDQDIEELTYKLGDMMLDFTVTACDGKTYTLSELLKEKDAVVLNFWYMNCGPCKMEFPFLQEAYAEYSDKIEVLALNPVDGDDASIAAFQKENGLTFPMAKVDAAWADIMQLTAYPTTVVVDRFGNITLIHKGAIDKAQTFKDVFAYFTAEDYQQKLVTDITEIETVAEEGSKENPVELGGVENFKVTVAPGQVVYNDLYKVNDMYLQIYSDDAYVIYNDKTYKPDGGVISVLLTCPDTNSPANVGIGNSSDKEQTFTVYLIPKGGTFSNPYSMNLGEFNVYVEAGNEEGVHYKYTAAEDGILTMQCISASVSNYGYYLYNLDSYAMRNLEADSQTDASGARTVSIEVRKGQSVLFCASTLPDDSGNYPSGSFKFNAAFTAAQLKEEVVIEKINYSVTVTDGENNPLEGVTVWLTTQNGTMSQKTDAKGVATFELEKGTYSGSISIPEGYLLENNAFSLTEDVTSVSVKVEKEVIILIDYTVNVVNKAGEPLSGAKVMIGTNLLTTDEQGSAVFSLPEGSYVVSIMPPDNYIAEQYSYAFEENATELTITLEYPLGSEHNPRDVNKLTYAPAVTAPEEKDYVNLYYEDAPTLTITEPGATVTIGDVTYTATETTPIEIQLESSDGQTPLSVIFGFEEGKEVKAYTMELVYPLGSKQNPQPLPATVGRIDKTLSAGDTDGYYYSYTATGTSGYVTLTVQTASKNKPYDIVITRKDNTYKLSDSGSIANGASVSVPMPKDTTILIHFDVEPFESGSFRVIINGSFRAEYIPDDPVEEEPDDGSTEAEYVVNVQNVTDKPMEGGVYVNVKNSENQVVWMEHITDPNGGTITKTLPKADYTVELAISDQTSGFRYCADTAKLSAKKHELTMYVALPIASDTQTSQYCGFDFLPVSIGGTYLKINAYDSHPSYKKVDDYGYCFYMIELTQDGKYTFTTDNGAVITDWGMNEQFVSNQTSYDEYDTGAFTIELKESNFGGGTRHQFFAVRVTEDISETVVLITREDVVYDEHDAPWTTYEGTTQPETVYNEESRMYLAADDIFTLSMGANQQLTYVDMTKTAQDYTLVYNTADGYYHLGTANGPIIYVNLGVDAPYKSMYNFVGAGGAGGTALNKIFYNPDGTPVTNTAPDGSVTYVKEDYTMCMLAYSLHIDSTYGVYPLTQDLKYILENGCAYKGWYTYGNDNYLFGTAQVDPALAWMFACCYITNK